MVAPPHRMMMSVEDYLTLDRNSLEARYEFIDGYAYSHHCCGSAFANH